MYNSGIHTGLCVLKHWNTVYTPLIIDELSNSFAINRWSQIFSLIAHSTSLLSHKLYSRIVQNFNTEVILLLVTMVSNIIKLKGIKFNYSCLFILTVWMKNLYGILSLPYREMKPAKFCRLLPVLTLQQIQQQDNPSSQPCWVALSNTRWSGGLAEQGTNAEWPLLV